MVSRCILTRVEIAGGTDPECPVFGSKLSDRVPLLLTATLSRILFQTGGAALVLVKLAKQNSGGALNMPRRFELQAHNYSYGKQGGNNTWPFFHGTALF